MTPPPLKSGLTASKAIEDLLACGDGEYELRQIDGAWQLSASPPYNPAAYREFCCAVLKRKHCTGPITVIAIECLTENIEAEITLRHNDNARAWAFSRLLERALRRGSFRAHRLIADPRV